MKELLNMPDPNPIDLTNLARRLFAHIDKFTITTLTEEKFVEKFKEVWEEYFDED